jgi:hypothetical protein
VIGRYGAWCDEVFEVRNLNQLEAFVERVAEQGMGAGKTRGKRSTGVVPVPMNLSSTRE